MPAVGPQETIHVAYHWCSVIFYNIAKYNLVFDGALLKPDFWVPSFFYEDRKVDKFTDIWLPNIWNVAKMWLFLFIVLSLAAFMDFAIFFWTLLRNNFVVDKNIKYYVQWNWFSSTFKDLNYKISGQFYEVLLNMRYLRNLVLFGVLLKSNPTTINFETGVHKHFNRCIWMNLMKSKCSRGSPFSTVNICLVPWV